MNISRKYYLRVIVVVVLLISIIKLTSYLSLANTIYNLFAKENSNELALSPSITEIPKKGTALRVDKILISKQQDGDQYDLFLINQDGTEEQLTNTPYSEMNAQFSPDGKSIVFAANKDTDDYDVMRLDLETNSLTNLSNNSTSDWDPTYSPEGHTIAFRSNRFDKNGDILTMEEFGQNPKNVTPRMRGSEEWGPTFSPNGKTIFFVSGIDEKSELYSMDLENLKEIKITENSTDDWYPKVSPDGNKIVHVCKDKDNPTGPDQICTTSIETKITELIPNQPKDSDNDDPVFSTDGNSIYFVHLDSKDVYNLWSINLDGSGLEQITSGDQTVLSPAVISNLSR